MRRADCSISPSVAPVIFLSASALDSASCRRRNGPARSSRPSTSLRIMRCGMPSICVVTTMSSVVAAV
jgi:hypothetical protein